MSSRTRSFGYVLALLVALFCMAPTAFAGNGTITAQLNNPPSNNVLDSIYVGPYNGTNTETGAAMQMTCDDFKDESDYSVATYSVRAFSPTNLIGTLWGSLQNAAMLYEEAGWLDLGMMHQSGATQGYYSYALWAIFDSADVVAWLQQNGDTAAYNAVFGTGGLLQQAQAACRDGVSCDYTNMLILTPGCNGSKCQEQEFLLFQTPEGGSTLLYLGLAGLAFLGAVRKSRRRTAAAAL